GSAKRLACASRLTLKLKQPHLPHIGHSSPIFHHALQACSCLRAMSITCVILGRTTPNGTQISSAWVVIKQQRAQTRHDTVMPRHFFSITHWSGCWCLRAKSITCVTLVSATSYV